MKRVAIAVLLLTAVTSVHAAPLGLRLRQQQKLQQPVRPRAALRRSAVENLVYGFYVKQFQEQGDVSSDIWTKMLPFLDQFIHDRFEIADRRQRALQQLRQAVNGTRNASEEELKRLVRELDTADAEFQANQERFLKSVDPLLTPRQQARLRVLQVEADNRVRQMLNAVQNPPAQRQNPAPAASPN